MKFRLFEADFIGHEVQEGWRSLKYCTMLMIFVLYHYDRKLRSHSYSLDNALDNIQLIGSIMARVASFWPHTLPLQLDAKRLKNP